MRKHFLMGSCYCCQLLDQEKKSVTKYTGQVSRPIYRRVDLGNCSWLEEIKNYPSIWSNRHD